MKTNQKIVIIFLLCIILFINIIKLTKSNTEKTGICIKNKIVEEKDYMIETTVQKTSKKKIKKIQKKTTTKNQNKEQYKEYAKDLVLNQYNWTIEDYEALVNLWNKESGWNPLSKNKSSGACGIPQSLPCSKMKSEGSDYKTNYKTQIRWGLKYIKNRYGSPSKAWQHFQKKRWY